MRKYVVYVLLFVLLTSFSLAAREDLTGKSYVLVNAGITSTIETHTTTDAEVEHIIADLYFYPQESENIEIQQLLPLYGGRVNEKNIEWVWVHPEKQLPFGIQSTLKSYPAHIAITQPTPFPLPPLDPSLQQYLVDTPHIDASHPDVIALASQLAEGETNQFSVVSKLAFWARNNINYNLSTLTVDVSQKASWVLENRYGVCDELTNVFIALNRALGIPARFISGISYTNSAQFQDPWNPHGWAEVYFPGYGWIPFDPTYGQYGWVDATHIKMRESLDPEEPSTTYEWRGRGITLRPQDLTFTTQLTETGEDLPALVSLQTEIVKEHIGFGSYDYLVTNVHNPQPFYQAVELSASHTPEMNYIDSQKQLSILAPGEQQNIGWRFFTPNTLDERYTYDVPVIVSTSRNENSSTRFETSTDHAVYTKEEIDNSYQQIQLEEDKSYSREVDLTCKAWTDKFYQNQKTNITCSFHNLGNTYLENVKICLETRCQDGINVGIGQTQHIIFPLSWDDRGDKELEVTISNEHINKFFSVPISRADFPDVTIKNIKAPKEVKFGDTFTISFTVARTSQDPPKNVSVVFSRSGVDKVWDVSELHEQVYTITLYAEDFDGLENTFDITAYFTSPNGEHIERTASVTVALDQTTVSYTRRIRMFFNGLVNWVEGLFT